ncbi:hypothetical protein C0W92_01495 [Photobacterium angustum]|uniref:hypothetical protein n=1 Tax=Photobacterium angustum TaxID=661 RepID=UPI0005E82ACF|nr:hypothetical protein [Photobacterium angustum]KJG03143.1 hypothetical protein UB35_05490 [Photobacterium angustum]KJG17934.1 hypothetical protein UA33_08250 [Photobacterium angustum]KJG24593.1 hypothetical protein UA39_07810 [Photobacterium angustum]KJG31971.1 hypothetical protein UA69_06755 [Photobacterium angustum]KJG32720.1 hypothetical protein UA36_04535 [Photobacterium angustum]
MKKWSLLALASALLLGCGSNDAEDAIVETVGLDIDSLSSQQKQDYAQISTDINTLILYIAGQCFNAESERNPDMEITGFTCNIADHKDAVSQTQFSSISLNSGMLDINRSSQTEFKIQTKDNVKFHAASISDGTLNYRLVDDNAIQFIINETGTDSASFRGFFRDDKTVDVTYWTVESLATTPFDYDEDTNNQHSWLANGTAKITGKDDKTFDWRTSATGEVELPLTE